MKDVEIKFEWKGKVYSGILSHVQGAAGTEIYHLYIDKYYKGTLRKYQGKWVFDSPKNEMIELAEFFGSEIESS